MAFYNLFLWHLTLSLNEARTGLLLAKARAIGNVHIYFDLIAFTVLMHFTGAIENPFMLLISFKAWFHDKENHFGSTAFPFSGVVLFKGFLTRSGSYKT